MDFTHTGRLHPGSFATIVRMEKKYRTGLMWFRRDLRTEDNAALHHALQSCGRVFCIFIFDQDILALLAPQDRRVEFIHESLLDLDSQLGQLASENGTPDVGRMLFLPTTTTSLRPSLGTQKYLHCWTVRAWLFTRSRIMSFLKSLKC
jgi:hypothetical protein